MKTYQPRIYSVNRLDIVLQQVQPDGTCDPEDDVPAQPVYLAADVDPLIAENAEMKVELERARFTLGGQRQSIEAWNARSAQWDEERAHLYETIRNWIVSPGTMKALTADRNRLQAIVARLLPLFEERAEAWQRAGMRVAPFREPEEIDLTARFAVADLRAALEVIRG